MNTPLPQPSAEERAHSGRLVALIREEITSQGPMPFSRFMELALYAPGLGYYSAGSTKFGPAGDFVTAPELGPLFARCMAQAGVRVDGEAELQVDTLRCANCSTPTLKWTCKGTVEHTGVEAAEGTPAALEAPECK